MREDAEGVAVLAIDHVQLAMPAGGEARARDFYGRLLGLGEVPKPAPLAARGGLWFELGAVRIHLGVEADFRPARKAHPGLVVAGFARLIGRLAAAGYRAVPAEPIGTTERVHVHDPFGNRIELIAADDERTSGA